MSNPRFSIIPAGAVTDRSLEPRDLQVLCLLGRHTDKAGWCTRSQVKMAQEIDCSRGSVQNSLDRLSTAGWIEMKRRDVEVEEAGKRPSRSYAYRVLLDRDDYSFESVVASRDDDETDSHAENASEEGGCQQDGTPQDLPQDPKGVPTGEHPGANPCDGTPANTYDGTKNVPLERPLLERERDARARDRKARFLVSFEARWPTAAADNRQRTAYAADALTEAEEESALAGIAPFLENQKRLGRKNVPAGWRYLEEKRWTLLEAQKAAAPGPSVAWSPDSVEAKAIMVLHELVGRMEAFRKIWRRRDGSVSFPKSVTPQLAALAQAPPETEWIVLTREGAGSWERMLREFFEPALSRAHLREGSRAPWPFAPSAEGKLYPAGSAPPPETRKTGPPEALMTEQDFADLKS